MLKINDTFYSQGDFEDQYKRFDKLNLIDNTLPIRIAVCLEDTFTWLALCFYFQQKRVSVMPIHPSTPLQTAQRLAARAGCTTLFYHTLDTSIELPSSAIEYSAAGLIQMSSGTTGDPKCINRSWDTIDIELESYVNSFSKAEGMTPIIACPVTHSYGLIAGVMVALKRGCTPIIVTNINPKYLIKTLLKTEKPLLYSSPTMLQGLVRLWPADKKIHAVMTSGTIMSRHVFEELAPRISHLFQQYGCSEAGCISINQDMKAPSDIGTPLPHLNVSSGSGIETPEEIVVRVEKSVNTPEQTIHTQDLGYLDEDENGLKQLHFVSRLDDTIIVAGLNVYPQDVEDIILTHPEIDDAVIFKIEDQFAGQRVCLQYVSPKAIPGNEVRNWCANHLATYQIPQQLIQVESIERLPNGKVSRKKLAQTFLEQQQAARKKTVAVADA